MIDLKTLKSENQRWHQQHATWAEEALRWQRETQRLAALLYMLDRALPEHSATLTKHVLLIEQHEKLATRYESGLDETCFPHCPEFSDEQEQQEFHQTLCRLHAEAELEHAKLKRVYTQEMERFKSLAQKLLNDSQ